MTRNLINAEFALAWGLNIRQAIFYSWLVSNSLTWASEVHNELGFKLIDKEVLLDAVKPTYQTHSGIKGTLLKMQSLNLMRVGGDKERYAICLNQDLLYQWCLAHSTLREVSNG